MGKYGRKTTYKAVFGGCTKKNGWISKKRVS
jgi:hypothetical protein